MVGNWFLGPDGAIAVLAAAWLALELPGALAAGRDLILRRPLYPGGQMYVPNMVRCTPAARASRHHLRPTREERRAMAEDDSERITSSHWPPQQQSTQGLPFPGAPRPPRRRGGLLAGLVALAATVLLGAIVAGAYYLGHSSSAAPKPQTAKAPAAVASTPATKSMVGKVTMPRYSTPHSPYDTPNWKMTSLGCQGVGGFDDMGAGTSVTVYDASGTIVGSGGLVFGIRHGDTCEWDFGINDLPDVPFYQVEVSHRGKITVANADLGQVALTLGS